MAANPPRWIVALAGALAMVALAAGCEGEPGPGDETSLAGAATSDELIGMDERPFLPPPTPRGGTEASGRRAIPLDVLWVVDDSTSMCQEQRALASAFTAFVAALGRAGNVDIRTAVTTTDVLGDDVQGAFQARPAERYPPYCQERRVFPAISDLHCVCAACSGWEEAESYQRCADDEGCELAPELAPVYVECLKQGGCAGDPESNRWVAEAPRDLSWIYNGNGSVNATCRFTCGLHTDGVSVADALCVRTFGDVGMECRALSEFAGDSGCIGRPATADCPADLPAVLPAFDRQGQLRYGLDRFRCLATVGAKQSMTAAHEQGLSAAWLALDPDGPNATQVCDPFDPVLKVPGLTPAEKRVRCRRVFLREQAWLLVIFVSDEDDCSLADGAHIASKDVGHCALLADTDMRPDESPVAKELLHPDTSERPLLSVRKAGERLLSIDVDASRILVAAVVGDALSDAEPLGAPARDLARQAYVDAKVDAANPMRMNTHVCASAAGKADLGLRYLKFVEFFGSHGFSENICSPDGLWRSLGRLAQRVLATVRAE